MLPAPDVFRFVRQDGELPDCAIASLAHFAGVSYAEALAAFPRPDRVVRAGAYMTELVAAALALGIKTKLRKLSKRCDLDEDTGILHVSGKDEHLVYLWVGRVIEGNGECYLTAHDYMRINKCKPQWLLQKETEDDVRRFRARGQVVAGANGRRKGLQRHRR